MKTRIIFIFVMMLLLLVITVLPVADEMKDSENIAENQNWEDEWPMFQHDLGKTGYSTSKAPNTNTVLWNYTTGNDVVSPPAVVNRKVYVVSMDDTFYCLDADTGEKLWDYPIPGATNCFSCPTVYDGKVYIATKYYNIYCWDADTGDLIWTIPKPYGSPLSPAVSEGRVYVGYGLDNWGTLLCLDADTGEKFWKYNFDKFIGSPTVYEGKVYVGCNDFYLYCLDAESSELIWSHLGVDWMFSPPAVVDGKVYSSGDRGCCLDAETGELLWKEGTLPRRILGSPAVAYGRVYIYAEDVYCLDAENGEEIWKYLTGCSWGYSSPAVADGKVYVNIYATKKLICLDAYIGEKLWDYQCGKYHQSSPAVAYGRVYTGGGSTDKIYCFEDPPMPPSIPTITGETNGKVGTEYEYIFNAEDPNGDDVKYHINWDDGDSDTTAFNPSGTDVKVKHIWNNEGTYTITAYAEDEVGLVGPESTFVVSITKKPRAINTPFLNFLQQHTNLFPILQKLLQRLGLQN